MSCCFPIVDLIPDCFHCFLYLMLLLCFPFLLWNCSECSVDLGGSIFKNEHQDLGHIAFKFNINESWPQSMTRLCMTGWDGRSYFKLGWAVYTGLVRWHSNTICCVNSYLFFFFERWSIGCHFASRLHKGWVSPYLIPFGFLYDTYLGIGYGQAS